MNLQTLYLFYAPVTDVGLKELAGLKNLQVLDLSHTRVMGPGLKELASRMAWRKSCSRTIEPLPTEPVPFSSSPIDPGLQVSGGKRKLVSERAARQFFTLSLFGATREIVRLSAQDLG